MAVVGGLDGKCRGLQWPRPLVAFRHHAARYNSLATRYNHGRRFLFTYFSFLLIRCVMIACTRLIQGVF